MRPFSSGARPSAAVASERSTALPLVPRALDVPPRPPSSAGAPAHAQAQAQAPLLACLDAPASRRPGASARPPARPRLATRAQALAGLAVVLLACACGAPGLPRAQAADAVSPRAEPLTPAAIAQELKSFGTVATVLHVAAHPDDENTQLITYLARGRGYRTAYLSITRGDGGQNEIGPEFGEKLGLARTQELLAARRLDGGRQFFTRALDYGFSKDVNEALRLWDRHEVLADVVRVYREFRPDVVITRFSPQPSTTHGHHTASAVLAIEAFKLSGDPAAFPEQLAEGLTPWQPRRIFINSGFGGTPNADVKMDVGGTDPVLDESFASIARRSRAMHITQGFGNFAGPAATRAGGSADAARVETFVLVGGDPASTDIMEGVDTTWTRFPGGADIAAPAAEALARFDPANPAASVPALLALRGRLATLPSDLVVDDKRLQLDRLLQACLGLVVETTAPQVEVVPGEDVALTASARLTGAAPPVPVRLVEVRAPTLASIRPTATLTPGRPTTDTLTFTVPKTTPVTQPYWLREEPTAGMFRVAETRLIGQPENPPPFPVEYVFAVGGQTLVVPDEPLAATTAGKPPRRLAVISPVSLQFGSGVALFHPGAKKTITVDVTASRAGAAGTLRVEAPTGWTLTPAAQPFRLAEAGAKTTVTFTVAAPAEAATGTFLAVAEIEGTRYGNQRFELRYPHIPVQLLQAPARLRVAAFDHDIRGRSVGYLPGAGDDTVEALTQLGYLVTTLSGADLTVERLRGFDAVVIGVRAFNERTDLAPNLPALFAYVEQGGTVIAQYNRPNGLNTPQLGPYELSIAGPAPRFRVTDEGSPVSFLAPDHAALNSPNVIRPADFNGWVQERGAYFPSNWDAARYLPLLALNDPGEAALTSGVLIAKHGKGTYVYTGLAFFRQLPAGVPGAYRLFANLVSLGK